MPAEPKKKAAKKPAAKTTKKAKKQESTGLNQKDDDADAPNMGDDLDQEQNGEEGNEGDALVQQDFDEDDVDSFDSNDDDNDDNLLDLGKDEDNDDEDDGSDDGSDDEALIQLDQTPKNDPEKKEEEKDAGANEKVDTDKVAKDKAPADGDAAAAKKGGDAAAKGGDAAAAGGDAKKGGDAATAKPAKEGGDAPANAGDAAPAETTPPKEGGAKEGGAAPAKKSAEEQKKEDDQEMAEDDEKGKEAKPAETGADNDKAPTKEKREQGGGGKGEEDYSKPGTLPFADLWGPDVKYSDQLANGDIDDDKELEDEDDPNDLIADDNGFVHQWLQTDSKINMGDQDGDDELIDLGLDDEAPQEDNLLQLDSQESRGGKGEDQPSTAWQAILAQIDNKKGIEKLV